MEATSRDGAEAVYRAALVYLEKGWSILPLSPPDPRLSGDSRTISGKLASRGRFYLRPISDKGGLAADDFLSGGVGIVTGRRSGLIVLDVDGPAGAASFAQLQLPPTRRVSTRHGFHAYYAYPEGLQRIPSSPGTLAPGIDVKADDGFVCAPPTSHAEGGHYTWLDEDAPIAALPADVLERLLALPHRSRWKQYRRYLYRRYLRHPLNALTGI